MGAPFDLMLVEMTVGARPFRYFGEGGEGMRWGRRDVGACAAVLVFIFLEG